MPRHTVDDRLSDPLCSQITAQQRRIKISCWKTSLRFPTIREHSLITEPKGTVNTWPSVSGDSRVEVWRRQLGEHRREAADLRVQVALKERKARVAPCIVGVMTGRRDDVHLARPSAWPSVNICQDFHVRKYYHNDVRQLPNTSGS